MIKKKCGIATLIIVESTLKADEKIVARKFKLDKTCTDLNYSDNLQVIAQIITIQLIVDKEKYPTQRLVCVLFLDNNLHLI